MNEFNTKKANEFESYKAELEAEKKKAQYEYRKMLRKLCPSQEMRLKAKRLSNRNYPCTNCAYYNEKIWKCENPHVYMYSSYIDTDHCYEGILRQLLKEAEAERDFEFEKMEAICTEMSGALENAVDMGINAMELARSFARWIIIMTDGNRKMPLEMVKTIRESLDWLNEILEPPNDDEAEEDWI